MKSVILKRKYGQFTLNVFKSHYLHLWARECIVWKEDTGVTVGQISQNCQ